MAGEGEAGRFEVYLRARGHDEATVEAFVRIAERITSVAGGWVVRPEHVDEAVRRAESEGAGSQQLADLKRVGDALVDFARASAPMPLSLPTADAPPEPPPAAVPLAEQACPRCGAVGGLIHFSPGERSKILTQIAGAAGGVLGMVGVRLFGCFGVVALLLALGAIATMYRAVLLHTSCKACDQVLDDASLPSALAADRARARFRSFLSSLALGAGAVLVFVLWIGIAASLQP